ncbi:AAA domain-containing protein [Sulfurisphaera ohwakuensis]|uniref:AAA domain-containing protein n=1 Tax=Sulfurisphaera ohwakuensis TaxID=69656 RepID=UPI0036F37F0C
MYFIKDIILENLQKSPVTYSLNPSQVRAVDIIKRAYNNRETGLVQGPPGTGKTSVIVASMRDILHKLDKNEVLVYVAPTNKLVYDVMRHVIPMLAELYSKNPDDITKAIRVFGSDFNYKDVPRVRSPIDSNVKVIITTDYQKFYVNYKYAADRGFSFTFLVDEASKSPIYRFLTPIALELIRAHKLNNKIAIDSLSVVGDPMQAISKKSIYRTHREYMLMVTLLINMIADIDKNLVEELKKNTANMYITLLKYSNLLSKINNFEMLDTTYRLPDPSHKIISKGFYNNLLKAHNHIKDRLTYDSGLIRYFSNCLESNKFISQKILDAVSNEIGIIYFRVSDVAYEDSHGENIDIKRAYIAVKAAITASIVTGKNTTIIPVYKDMVNYIKFIMEAENSFSSCINELKKKNVIISIATAHALLGAEDENTVLILGKEYLPQSPNIFDTATMYFIEPEIFNVQFSRHKALSIIIGNVERLMRNSGKVIKDYHSKKAKGLYDEILYSNSLLLRDSVEEILDLCGIEVKGNKVITRNSDMCETISEM